ncbi:MAG: MarC family protein [Prolixibacteraceae bacterium]
MNWDLYLNFLAAMFAIVNPVALLPFWSQLTDDLEKKVRRNTAYLTISTSFFILLVFLISGKHILSFFSINLSVFKIAGGILLLFAGLAMVNAKNEELKHKSKSVGKSFHAAKLRFKEIIVPMAIPMLSGPGSITTVVLYGNKTSSLWDFIFLSVVLLLTMAFLMTIFVFSEFLEKKVDPLVFNILIRLFGIIVVAIAIQFIVTGIGEVFPILTQETPAV